MTGLNRDELTKLIYDNELFHGTVGIGIVMDMTHIEKFAELAAPPKKEWVGLTDAEVEKVFFDMGQFAKIDLKTFARAIEAKLKEKNT